MSFIPPDGWTAWSGGRDEYGWRTWYIVFRVESDDPGNDGPAGALLAPGLPLVGSLWNFGNDRDDWAWCTFETDVKQVEGDGEKNQFFDVKFKFTNKPPQVQRCNDTSIEDPLLEPFKLSISGQNFTEEATEDRYGRPILNSAWEEFRGPKVEFDRARSSVNIEMNVLRLSAEIWGPLQDTVNDRPLWGLPARCIKLAPVDAERKFWGTCFQYFTLKFKFEINCRRDTRTGQIVSGWDRDLLDEGTKMLIGHWKDPGKNDLTWVLDNVNGLPPDPGNPAHFIRATDPQGNPIRVVLDGAGKPVDTRSLGNIVGLNTTGPGNPIIVYSDKAHNLIEDDEVAVTILPLDGNFDALFSNDLAANGTWNVSMVGVADPIKQFFLTASATDPQNSSFSGDAGGYWRRLSRGPGSIHVENYQQANFLVLGIPTIIGP